MPRSVVTNIKILSVVMRHNDGSINHEFLEVRSLTSYFNFDVNSRNTKSFYQCVCNRCFDKMQVTSTRADINHRHCKRFPLSELNFWVLARAANVPETSDISHRKRSNKITAWVFANVGC